MGGRGTYSLTYQGKNNGSGKAIGMGLNWDERSARDSIEKFVKQYPLSGNDSGALAQIRAIENGDSPVRVYRATPGNSINQGDWVFLSQERAENWCKGPITRNPKPGFKVIQATIKAKDIDWTGKNLEFVYTGRKWLK